MSLRPVKHAQMKSKENLVLIYVYMCVKFHACVFVIPVSLWVFAPVCQLTFDPPVCLRVPAAARSGWRGLPDVRCLYAPVYGRLTLMKV